MVVTSNSVSTLISSSMITPSNISTSLSVYLASYLDRGLDAIQDSGIDRDWRRTVCYSDISPTLHLTWCGSTILTQPMGCCRMRLTNIVAFVTMYTTQSEFGRWLSVHFTIDIRFLYSFQENLESVGGCDQVRFVEVSTTAVTRAMVKSVSTRYLIAQDKTIRKINFKAGVWSAWLTNNNIMFMYVYCVDDKVGDGCQ